MVWSCQFEAFASSGILGLDQNILFRPPFDQVTIKTVKYHGTSIPTN